MVGKNSGLIINMSSAGGLRYIFNVAYGVGKEAVSYNFIVSKYLVSIQYVD